MPVPQANAVRGTSATLLALPYIQHYLLSVQKQVLPQHLKRDAACPAHSLLPPQNSPIWSLPLQEAKCKAVRPLSSAAQGSAPSSSSCCTDTTKTEGKEARTERPRKPSCRLPGLERAAQGPPRQGADGRETLLDACPVGSTVTRDFLLRAQLSATDSACSNYLSRGRTSQKDPGPQSQEF